MIPVKECLRKLAGFVQSIRLANHAKPWPQRSEGAATLIIAPHQDDEILGCGLLIMDRLAAKQKVHIVYLTDGSGSHPNHPSITPPALASLRRQEALAVADLLGLPRHHLHFLDSPDGKLNALPTEEALRLRSALVSILKSDCFDEVFTPLFCDGSTEHEAAFPLVQSALSPQIRLLQYPVWAHWAPWRLSRALEGSSLVYRLHRPSFQTMKKKALSLYQSQVTPQTPWKFSALSPGFLAMFDKADEFYFEYPSLLKNP